MSLGTKKDKSPEPQLKKSTKSVTAPNDLGPKPKGVTSAYIYFNTDYCRKLRENDKESKQSDLMSLAGQKWVTMSEKDKAPWEALKQKDVKRHEKQMAEREKKGYFTLDDGSKSTDAANAKLFKEKKSKKTADESDEDDRVCKPKAARSAYTYFTTEYTAKLRAENKDENAKQTDFMKMAGAKWNTMTESDKKPYEAMRAADVIR